MIDKKLSVMLDMGGDCTNFASQVLDTGGIPTDKEWKPYTVPWVNVVSFYNYLISHKLAKECQLSELKPGDFIQYLGPQRYSHTVVVVASGADPIVDSHTILEAVLRVIEAFALRNNLDFLIYLDLCITLIINF
ncbi:17881_t:CDS:2 [Racocetra fulgida]|uniref:17881_t:CDS:1 n=1 Tax=Racocetra fulgida TaxID=60492 RepID=A0A9N8WLD3_9GLOM|nr:17881_t:CDS:2 [Racocetra fulgida]